MISWTIRDKTLNLLMAFGNVLVHFVINFFKYKQGENVIIH